MAKLCRWPLLVATLNACSFEAPVLENDEQRFSRGVATTFAVDPAFTSTERLELEAATRDAVREDLVVVIVDGEADGTIVRGRAPGEYYEPHQCGAYSPRRLTIWIDAEHEWCGANMRIAALELFRDLAD